MNDINVTVGGNIRTQKSVIQAPDLGPQTSEATVTSREELTCVVECLDTFFFFFLVA